MKIKKISINNFQSHENTEIEFTSGLNIITGSSDSGKTAILRAIKWVLFNEPKGTDFIRQGEKEASVSIYFEDNTIITRKKKTNKNQYIIVNNNGEEQFFEGFGNEIPKEVLHTHNIRKTVIDSSSSQCINLGEQLQGPFMISQDGKTVAKAIGKLIGMDKLDEAIKQVVKDIFNNNVRHREALKKIESLESEISLYSYLEELESKIIEKEKLLKTVKEKVARLNKLILIKDRLDIAKVDYEKSMKVLATLKNVDKADSNYVELLQKHFYLKTYIKSKNQLDSLRTEKMDLQKIMISFRDLSYVYNLTKEIDENLNLYNKIIILKGKYLEMYKRINLGKGYLSSLLSLDEAEGIYSILLKNCGMLKVLKDKNSSINNINNLLEEDNKIMLKERDFIDSLGKQYGVLLTEFKQCPLCNSPMDINSINSIVKSITGGV